MNTAKILDVAPQTAPASAPAPVTPARPEPQSVPSIGNGATADLIEKRAQGQAQAAEEDRKRAAAKPARTPNFNREVGLIDDTFEVFVDLVSASRQDHRFRIFGPRENSGPALPSMPTADPASAKAAYKAGSGAAPLPNSLKTDV